MRVAEALSLRPYQLDALDALRARLRSGKRRLVLIAPTGAGKTVIASAMVRNAVALGHRVLFLAHRRELISQAVDKLQRLDVEAGIIMAGERPRPELAVQVASVQTLARREKPPARLVVVDECHHSTSASWRAILDAYPDATIIGLTATPWRTDRVGLKDLYEDAVLASTPAELIRGGALCGYDAFAYDSPDLHGVKVRAGEFQADDLALACNTSVLVGNVVKEYLEHTPGRRALAFAVNVEHSRSIASQFNDAGVAARHVDYQTPADERARAVEEARTGRVLVLSSVSLFSEGFDLPEAEVCIMARPTLSLSLHLQMIGRVMRPADGKERAVINDHGGNLLRHGLPDEERDYSLTATPKRVAELHSCPFCRQVFGRLEDTGACPKCGEIIAPPREVREENERREKARIEGERINAEEIKRRREEANKKAPESKRISYFLKLQKEARAKKYKAGWVGMRFKARFGHWPNYSAAQIAAVKYASDERDGVLESCICHLGHPPCSYCTDGARGVA